MAGFITGNRLRSGVTMPVPTQLGLDGSNLVMTSPPRPAADKSAGGSETILPLRSIVSLTLDLPEKNRCKWIAAAFGMAIGFGSGSFVSQQGGPNLRGTAAAVATVSGAVASGAAHAICMNQEGTLTIQTQREDFKFSIGGDMKEQLVQFFSELRSGLKHGSVVANATNFVGKVF